MPLPIDGQDPAFWKPFGSRLDFDFAHYHFVQVQSSARDIDVALDMWQASILKHGENVPWMNAKDLYNTIDLIQHGDAPWKTYTISYQGPRPPGTPPKWMTETYELCTRDSRRVLHNQLGSSEFKGMTNLVPYQQFNGEGKRIWSNLMSADWAWKQAVRLMHFIYKKHAIIIVDLQDIIAEDPTTHGAMFVPIIAGSDKTTVSVATGHQEYHPVYMSPGILTNTARRARGNAFLPVAFLPIPKSIIFDLLSHPNPTNIIPQRTRSIEGSQLSKNFADNYITPVSLLYLHPSRQE